MESYMVLLERKDRRKTYRYLKFECQVKDFYTALEVAEMKVKKLKLQVDIDYEIAKIEKQQ